MNVPPTDSRTTDRDPVIAGGASASTVAGPGPRAIFVNRFFHPDLSATSQMLTDITVALGSAGHDVTVITSRMRYDDPECVLPATDTLHDVRIERVTTTRFGRLRVAGRLCDYTSFYLGVCWRVWRTARAGDVLIVKTDPPLLGVVLEPVARLRRLTRVNWLQDLFPEIAESAGLRIGPSMLDRRVQASLRRLRDRSLASSAATVVISERMREIVARAVPAEHVHRIANWSDPDVVSPVAHADNPLRREWGLEGRFVVEYSGNLGFAHPIDAVIDAAEHLRHRPDIVFLFVGGGVRRASLEAAARRRGLLHAFRFQPYQPREALTHSLGAGDLHLVTLDPDMEGLILPSKFYGICAAGRPTVFVGDADGELARELRERGCGVHVDVDGGRALAAHIEAYADDPDRCTAEGARARDSMLASDTLEHALARWSALLSSFGNTPS